MGHLSVLVLCGYLVRNPRDQSGSSNNVSNLRSHSAVFYWPHRLALIYLFIFLACKANFFLIFIFFILFFNFTILYWFCHISKWIHHRYTCVPHPEPSSLLPPHTIPLGRPSAAAPSIQYRTSNLDWWLISYMILYMFQCHSPKSSHPLPLPQSSKDCSLYFWGLQNHCRWWLQSWN